MMMMMMIPGTNTYGTNTYRYSFRRYFGCMPLWWSTCSTWWSTCGSCRSGTRSPLSKGSGTVSTLTPTSQISRLWLGNGRMGSVPDDNNHRNCCLQLLMRVMNIHLLRTFQCIPMALRDGWDVVVLYVFVKTRPIQLLGEVAKKKGHSLVHIGKPPIRWVPVKCGWDNSKDEFRLPAGKFNSMGCCISSF